MTATRCSGPGCWAEASAIVAADRWLAVVQGGGWYAVCSQECAAAVLNELVSARGLARHPQPAALDAAAERLAPRAALQAARRGG